MTRKMKRKHHFQFMRSALDAHFIRARKSISQIEWKGFIFLNGRQMEKSGNPVSFGRRKNVFFSSFLAVAAIKSSYSRDDLQKPSSRV